MYYICKILIYLNSIIIVVSVKNIYATKSCNFKIIIHFNAIIVFASLSRGPHE